MQKEHTIEFDADVSPQNLHNKEAAAAHGLKFDSKAKIYRDADGAAVRDKFGQTL